MAKIPPGGIPLGKAAPKKPYPKAGWLAWCEVHGCWFYDEYDDHECPACQQFDRAERIEDGYKETLATRDRDMKLLKYELREARDAYKSLKLEAAGYLATKKVVRDHIDEHLR